ncbi:hypothetical protein F5B22DRAFT_633698 [Xylaria bambusicola]|uniref:uncharacterized protein n=1 Tax=Xylaria bambusicola TaxID=326684 RepID=UPI00200888D5|nr:uncharacterized protein F5B22DRAFT_633698 [Xylaria bambusicola]KAI0525629.1 hypothetical protein F5B22DRAFT_633698 [Xylaria bambusicola]
MDPSYWDAVTRHQAPKAKAGKATNSVERQFRKNPFAEALATPIRQCTASRTRLPSFFLQDFNLISHPETGQPWWVPRSLSWDKPVETQQAGVASDEPANAKLEREQPTISEGIPQSKLPDSIQTTSVKPYGPSAYALARRDIISSFTVKQSGLERHYRRLFGGSSSRYAKFGHQAVWREDMDSVILERMRQGIVEDLLYLSRLCSEDSRHYIVKCYGWDDVKYKHQGALLWFQGSSGHDEPTISEAQPGPFATYDIANENSTTSVAVHNMPMLLGITGAAGVRDKSAILRDGFLFMLAGRRTKDLQLKLWKLQGYLASYTEPS